MGLLNRISRHQARDNVAAVAAVEFEVAVSGDDNRLGQYFGHADEAGVCEAHGDVGVFVHEREHGNEFLSQIEEKLEAAAPQHFLDGWRAFRSDQVQGFGQCGFGGEPRFGEGVYLSVEPGMVLVVAANQGDERAAIGDDAFRHG